MSSLENQIVAVTGQRRAEEMSELIRRLGGVSYIAPTVNLRFEEALGEADRLAQEIIGGVDWAVFYTGVGVRALFSAAERLGRLDDFLNRLETSHVLSRGRKTLRALRDWNRAPDIQASPGTTEGVIAALSRENLAGRIVFVQTAGEIPPALEEAILDKGGLLRHGTPYFFHPPEDPAAVPGLIKKLISGEIGIIPFTSPPAVHNLLSAADEEGKADELVQALNEKTLTASIGPVTTEALRVYGVTPAIESESQKMGGLMQDIARRVSAGEGAASLEGKT